MLRDNNTVGLGNFYIEGFMLNNFVFVNIKAPKMMVTILNIAHRIFPMVHSQPVNMCLPIQKLQGCNGKVVTSLCSCVNLETCDKLVTML